jgi:hypothetical protein
MKKLFQKDAIDIGQYNSPATKYRYRAVRRLEVSPVTSPNKRQEEKAGRVAPVIVSSEMPKGVYLWLTL